MNSLDIYYIYLFIGVITRYIVVIVINNSILHKYLLYKSWHINEIDMFIFWTNKKKEIVRCL